jgi:hypothetical protein
MNQHRVLMVILPKWNERISTDGRPQNPLRANTVRNSITGNIVSGITTDVYPRGRYISGFCWAIYKATTHPTTKDWTQDEQKSLIKNIEEMMALATHRYPRKNSHIHKGDRGLTGSNSLDEDVFNKDGMIDLDEFQLLSSNYAVEVIQPNLMDFHLRQGELGVTGAGRDLAEAVDADLDIYPELVDRSRKSKVSVEFIDQISDEISLQAIFDNERFDSERDALQRVTLGMLEWDDSTVSLANWPSEINISIDEHIKYTNLGKSHSDDLRDSFESQQHHLRRAWFVFILRTHQILENQTSPFVLDDTDTDVFGDFIDVSRIYWLQVQTAYALRAQLSALCTYLEQEAPREVQQDNLFNKLGKTEIESDAAATLSMEVSESDGSLTTGQTVRDLLLAGESSESDYTWEIPETGTGSVEDVDDIRRKIKDMTENGWIPITTDRLTFQSVVPIINDSLNRLSRAQSTEEAERAFGKVLSRTTICLFLSASHYRKVMSNNESLEEYVTNVYGSYLSSIVRVSEFVEGFDGDTPIEEAALSLLEEKVISTHESVLRNRLNNNSPLTMCFDFNTERSSFRTAGGVSSPGLQWLRLGRSSVFLRDAGLLTHEDGSYKTTQKGEQVLQRLRGEW